MRRAGGVLLAVAVLALGAFGLLAYFNSRDDAEVATGAQELGHAVRNVCSQDRRVPARDGRLPRDDDRDHLLALGNVVLIGPVRELRPLQEQLTGPYDPEFAQAGQAIYVEPAEGTYALAWGREFLATGPDDPRLEDFVARYLGRGAQGECD